MCRSKCLPDPPEFSFWWEFLIFQDAHLIIFQTTHAGDNNGDGTVDEADGDCDNQQQRRDRNTKPGLPAIVPSLSLSTDRTHSLGASFGAGGMMHALGGSFAGVMQRVPQQVFADNTSPTSSCQKSHMDPPSTIGEQHRDSVVQESERLLDSSL